MCAIEDAAFEIRDVLMWVYGSGYPKSHNGPWGGTGLKPAWEPIILARKPLIGTVEENWREHGTGALDIAGCRIDGLGRWPANVLHDGSDEVVSLFPEAPGQIADISINGGSRSVNAYGNMKRPLVEHAGAASRGKASLSLFPGEDDSLPLIDAPSTLGNGRDGEPSANSANDGAVGFNMRPGARREDEGSAARFFYCAKASKADRDEGLDALPTVTADPYAQHRGRRMDDNDSRFDGKPPAQGKNHHPTVKPTELMRWLVRLVTPAGGTVLDPFSGSGSTGKAAALEGKSVVLIEREAEYIPIIRGRMEWAIRERCAATSQTSLFDSVA
jgi:site-specific DNA-methyltransferase (adenine-specific)